jgi:hypothetical protein
MGPGATFDLKAWSPKHGAAQCRPPLDKVIAALKEQNVTRFGVSGHCFGGKHASLTIPWKQTMQRIYSILKQHGMHLILHLKIPSMWSLDAIRQG